MALKALAQRTAGAPMPPGSAHRQPLRQRGVFQREPEGGDADAAWCQKKVASWCQPTSPPMPGCLKMYMDCHSLRLGKPQHPPATLGQCRAVREGLEHRVLVVQGVADLVDRQGFGLAELTIGTERLLFERTADRLG